MTASFTSQDMDRLLRTSRQASYAMAALSTDDKNRALITLAALIESNEAFLLAENQKDLDEQEDRITPALYQRLKLDASKLKQLVQGVHDVVRLQDPVGQCLAQTQLDDGLILDKVSVPLGVIAIVFESRPDVMPQILSLILKSGNAVVFKGGREAHHSNLAFMTLVNQLAERCPFLPSGWAQLLHSRDDFQQLLAYHQYVDLVIPRGSNELVQTVMANTKIPVLGHADGICHMYLHSAADVAQAIPIVLDAKAQYPAACNALETLLVDRAKADEFLPAFDSQSQARGMTLIGCDVTRQWLPLLQAATEADWRTEYGDLRLAVRVVDSLDDAINHINTYGSHHTDAILSTDKAAIEQFVQRVDSACVFANASTRFADGFRFGLGAEIGISTAKTHARGPVGLEGLVIYKYVLRGSGQCVNAYVGPNARLFQHRALQ